MMEQIRPEPAMVYLIGAGPGDPGLMTLAGIECLRRAGLVLYDYLVNRTILAHAASDAELVCLGGHAAGRLMTQEEINARMVAAARRGTTVARLKGGDPVVFGRMAEEIAALEAAGVPYRVVPGVTAASAAAAYAGIPITHGQLSSAVALVTGHERSQKAGPPLDYGALASFPGTLVFYMGVTSASQWSRDLIAQGKPPETPVAIVRRASWPDQRTLRTTLAEVEGVLVREHVRPPAVIAVGESVASAPERPTFENRPLSGRRVLLTRPREQTDAVWRRLDALGAEVLLQAAIRIGPPLDWRPADEALRDLEQFDWLVFSSANGVRFLLDRLFDQGGDLRRLGSTRIAAIGSGTAEELVRYRLRADRVPPQFRAESLAESLAVEAAGKRFLLARASRGREVLAEQLSAAGGLITQVVVYTSTDVDTPDPEVTAALVEGRIDWITVTSSAIARSLASLWGGELRRARLVSISPITSATLRELGFEPAAEAAEYTMDGVVEAILRAEEK
jgi:uroporphyrinogen III methyltransferase / synthase